MEDDDVNYGHPPHKKGAFKSTDAKQVWILGGVIVLLAILFSVVELTTKDKSIPVPDAQGVVTFSTGAQQAAFVPPSCVTCPSAPQCFPPANTGGQQVAYAPGCAQQVAYTPGCAQQVALTRQNPSAGTRSLGGQNALPYQVRGGYSNGTTGQKIVPPPIFRDAILPHEYRGICENCHIVKSVPGAATPVALQRPAVAPPPIFRDAVMPHKFRGVCENCHIVKPDIAIPATATVPHGYRGVCSNCHTILGLK